ncbi:MAG: DUF177 domain-containing protein [Flavobacteriaceae bacterium]|nr:DUF177 domain-containing protein [Flavobacteriaceae bacterium]
MKRLKKGYVIPFIGLKIGKHQFEYQIGKTFFEAYHYDDFLNADVVITLDFEKSGNLFELFFKAKGTFSVACDLTNEPFNQPIETNLDLVVKFGEEFNDDNEAILILPHSAYEINIKQYIFEMLVLAMPAKRIHPGIVSGTLKSDILEKLIELQPKQKLSLEEDKIDPRWSKLKNLRTEKKE